MPDTLALGGKVVIVTGASRGIGRAVAARAVAAGAKVACVGRDRTSLDATVSALGADRAMTCVADVTDAAAVARTVAAVNDRFGGIDALVNNAGVGLFSPVASMDLDAWHRLVATNLTAPFLWARVVIPALKARGGGTIVNISSLASRQPFAGGAAYAATKAGLNAFTEALLEEVRHDGIRVSLVLPGSVATRFGGRAEVEGADWKVAPEDVAEVVCQVLTQHPRALSSRIEIRPSRPARAGSARR
ncbi:MAG: SDR family NAD(P)-dependent oxidoreductase [Vicinamibacterales bacterium]